MSQIEDANLPTLDDMESLFVNNADLDAIRSHISRFNPIKTMGMERMEIRHSAILGWLLSPQETHGLGDAFLKAFLAKALFHDSAMRPSALDVSQADMMDAEVRREWRNIDLLVLSPRNGWVFIIENKFDSVQHSDQLKLYMDTVTKSLMDDKNYIDLRGIFLTLWDEEPADDRYAPIKYAMIGKLLEQIALSGRAPLSAEVDTFLRHYLNVILEATGMSDEQKQMEKLARQLYRDHRRVLDFVVEHGNSMDFSTACEAVFGEEPDYGDVIKVGKQSFVFCNGDANSISFMPKSWFDALGGDDELDWDCGGWCFPLIMWINLTSDAEDGSGRVRLYTEVGPLGNHDFRRELIEGIKDAAKEKGLKRIGFQRGAADEEKKYSKFFKKNFFSVDDVHDHEQIESAIKKALKSFQPEIEAVATVLPEFRSYGEEEA